MVVNKGIKGSISKHFQEWAFECFQKKSNGWSGRYIAFKMSSTT